MNNNKNILNRIGVVVNGGGLLPSGSSFGTHPTRNPSLQEIILDLPFGFQ